MGKEFRIGIVAGLVMLVVGIGIVLFRGDKPEPKTNVGEAVIAKTEKKEIGIIDTDNINSPSTPDYGPNGFDSPTDLPVVIGGGDTSEQVVIGGGDTSEQIVIGGGDASEKSGADLVADIADSSSEDKLPVSSEKKPDMEWFDGNIDPNKKAVVIGDGTTPDNGSLPAPDKKTDGGITDGIDGGGDSRDFVIPLPDQIDIRPILDTTGGAAPKTHTIQQGDNYWTLAEKYLGHGKYYLRFKDANPGINPDNLRLGTVVKIPPKPAAKATTATGGTAAATKRGTIVTSAAGTKTYTVAKNDTMSSIARKAYGNANLYHIIQKANPSVDPTRMIPGKTVLKIPPKPAAKPRTTTPSTPRRSSGGTAGPARRVPGQPWFGSN
ncbi:MAG: LysM peptidoglycan-binding domain-containing protein [Phycisphaerales bacterium]|jgi:nucleoid-associated protein YgaU|nr:LysM peptidoglycan-binding domain-containing protein [Phycisphaerales bacterium]MBT7171606.1 LysM peptidoglycan-binding domain-containing protein [Phycisphaerales bacterium]